MTIEEKIVLILTVGSRYFDKRSLSQDEKSIILRTYQEVTGVRMQENCGECFVTMYQFFNNYKKLNMSELLFKLHEGKKIMLHGAADVLTNANLTNEKAIRVLKKTPAAIVLFKTVPDNWRQLCDAPEDKPKPAPVVTAKAVAVEVGKTTPAPADGLNLEQTKRNNLESKSLKELKTIARNNELPLNKDSTKDQLIESILKAS